MMTKIPTNNNLTAVLENIFQDGSTFIFDENKNKIDKCAFNIGSFNSHLYNIPKYTIEISSSVIDENLPFFEDFFKDFVDKKTKMMKISSLLTNDNTEVSVRNFVQNNIMNAVMYLGSKAVCEILMEWKINNRIAYKIGFSLTGINVRKSIKFSKDGIILPSNTEENLIDNTLCFYNNNMSNVFYEPNCTEENIFILDDTEIGTFLTQFSNCLSLICNNYISLKMWWIDFGKMMFFNPAPVQVINFIHETKKEVELTQSNVDSALNLLPKLDVMLTNARYNRSLQRLLKSMQSYNKIDKAIELRIALDALFTSESERNPSVMMRNNAVLFFETKPSKRTKLCSELREFYTDASIILHGGKLTKTIGKKNKNKIEKEPRHLDTIQKFLCDALIKMANDGEVPDWDTFFMNLTMPQNEDINLPSRK